MKGIETKMRGPRGGYRETYRTISSGAALGTTLLMRMSCKDMTRNTLNQRQKMAQRERKSMESLMFSKAGLQPRPCDLMLLKILTDEGTIVPVEQICR
jgi:hypothetical protein